MMLNDLFEELLCSYFVCDAKDVVTIKAVKKELDFSHSTRKQLLCGFFQIPFKYLPGLNFFFLNTLDAHLNA
jgi:hypothetical protein